MPHTRRAKRAAVNHPPNIPGQSRKMHRVLAIPELLDMIFLHLDRKYNARNARVCKQWSEIALDRLWREVDDVCVLLRVLGEMKKDKRANSYHFACLPLPTDWMRFNKYAKRVRMLRCTSDTNIKSPISPSPLFSRELCYTLHHSVFDDIARTRTSLYILPNMRHLHWVAPYQYCVLFLHPGLKSLTLPTYDVPGPASGARSPLGELVSDVVSRSWNLVELHLQAGKPFLRPSRNDHDHNAGFLRSFPSHNHSHPDYPTPYPLRRVQTHILILLRGLPHLRKVVLPRFWFTNEVAEVLSVAKDLKCVEFHYDDAEGCGDPYDVLRFAPVFPELKPMHEGSEDVRDATKDTNVNQESPSENKTKSAHQGPFPSLSDLSLCTPFCNVPAFISSLALATQQNIIKLHISSPILEAASTIQEVLECLEEKMPFLEVVELVGLCTSKTDWEHVMQVPDQPQPDDASVEEGNGKGKGRSAHVPSLLRRLTFANLRPLLKLKNLRAVEIIHHMPISFSEEDLEVFIRELAGNADGGKGLEKVVLGGEPSVVDVDAGLSYMREDEETSEDGDEGDEDERDNPNEPILSLQHTIRTFAKYCPGLRHLGVFVEERSTLGDGDHVIGLDDLMEFPEVQSVSLPEALTSTGANVGAEASSSHQDTATSSASADEPNSDPNANTSPSNSKPRAAQQSKPKPIITIPQPPLSSLQSLAFGPSLIHNPSKVALFLSHFVSENVVVNWGVAWGGDEKEGYRGFLREKKMGSAGGSNGDSDSDEDDDESESDNGGHGQDEGGMPSIEHIIPPATSISPPPPPMALSLPPPPPITLPITAIQVPGLPGGGNGLNDTPALPAPVGAPHSTSNALAAAPPAPAIIPAGSTSASSLQGPIMIQGKIPPTIGINGSMDLLMMATLFERAERWRKVVELLPLLVRMRREERERIWGVWVRGMGVGGSGGMSGWVGVAAMVQSPGRVEPRSGSGSGDRQQRKDGRRKKGEKGKGKKVSVPGRDGCVIC